MEALPDNYRSIKQKYQLADETFGVEFAFEMKLYCFLYHSSIDRHW